MASLFEHKNIFKWYKLLAKSREDVNNDDCSDHHSTSITNENDKAGKTFLWKILESLLEKFEDTSVDSFNVIFSDVISILGGIAKFVSKLMHFDSNNYRYLLKRSSQVRKYGYMLMTSKPNLNHPNGNDKKI